MQQRIYNKDTQERYLGVFLPVEFAQDYLSGIRYIEITNHKPTLGDALLCSLNVAQGNKETLAIAELYAVKPVTELTEEEWQGTRVPRCKWGKIPKGNALFFRNVRRVVEMPVCGKGVKYIQFDNGDITAYPTHLIIDKKGWQQIKKMTK